MERNTYENYEQIEPKTYRPNPETSVSTLGAMVVNFVIFESIFGGLGSLGGNSVLGSSEAFAHTTAELAGLNNLAAHDYNQRSD